MERIVINAMLAASIDESSLWDIFCEINTIFPEHTQNKNLTIAKTATIWMYRTNKITFYSNDSDLEENFLKKKSFLYEQKDWDIDSGYVHNIFIALTDIGDAFYTTFVQDFKKSLKEDGLMRRGKKYKLNHRIIKKFENNQYLFWINELVRTLGMPPIHITSHLVQYTDSLTHTQCIVDTRTSLITDILRIAN